jgi:transposase
MSTFSTPTPCPDLVRHAMFQAAMVASHHNPVLKPFWKTTPHKPVITAVARKLVTIANALCKSRQNWASPAT